MQVHIYLRRKRPRRPSLTASLLLCLAGLAGFAHAVEFDEKLKAPLAKNGVELKAMAESYSASFARLRDASPVEMVTSKALTLEHVDLNWQIDRALEDRRPMEDLSAIGLVKDARGGFRVDLKAFPQWQPFPEALASIVPTMTMDTAGPLLVNRGFRESDVAAIKNYVDVHDLNAATQARTLPLAISFSRVVKKYDKIKRPVSKDQVFSYLYQRNRVAAEARRAWSEGLIRVLDDQRVRILHSYFSEMGGTSYWFADDADAGIAGVLAMMRLPDFEQRATAEAGGATP